MVLGNDNKKPAVPNFTSFKPKEATPGSDFQSENPKSGDSERGERRHRPSSRDPRSQHRHHDRHRRERGHREEGRRDSRDLDHGRRPKREPKQLPDATTVTSLPGLFVFDKKGDPLIRKYGLERSKVPSYHRLHGGRVLGTNGRLLLHHDGPREQFSLLFPGERKPGSRDTSGLRSRGWQKRRPVKLWAPRGNPLEGVAQGYLPLENPKKRKKLQTDSDASDAEEEQPSWRNIEGKAKAGQDASSDDEGSNGSLSGPDDADRNSLMKLKSIQLNRQIKDHPDDIEAWLDLADHQDALLRDGETIDNRAAECTANSFTEIKIYLLESALRHTSRPDDRQRVLLALMREGIKVWDRDVATKKWAQVSDDEHSSFALWRTHLDYSMSSIATVQYAEISKIFLERLHQTVSRSSLQTTEDLEEALYIFLRATRFLWDAGYRELAVAAWQALIELNLFRPEGAQSQSALLSAFQDFWEDEKPRIGEAGAQGWRHYVESGGLDGDPELVVSQEPAEAQAQDCYKAWAVVERAREEKAKMPARTMDPDTDDDPYRVVMYSDIEPWLFVIPRNCLPNATWQLIDAFLLFCGLPLAFRSSDWLETAYHDPFLTGTAAKMASQPSQEAEVGEQHALSRNSPWFSNGNCCARKSPALLFSGNGWFQYFDMADKEHIVASSWVELALEQLIYWAHIPELGLYYLGFCFTRKPDAIRKKAKALLKRSGADVQLYNAYALAEYANGNVEIACKVLMSALELPALNTAASGFLLFKTWSWIELERGDKKLAAKRLCACVDESLRKTPPDEDSVSLATALKARQAFALNAKQCLHEGLQEAASGHVECLALLSYLTDEGGSEPTSACQGNISAAMDVVEATSKEMRWREGRSNTACELISQWASIMLYFHATKGPFRRIYVREQLVRFVERFPRNTIFLNLFGWADATIRVVNETRQLLYDKVLVKKHDSVRGRIFAIQHELRSGNVNSTRAAFEHAVRSEACKWNAMVWVWYLRFCQSHQQLQAQAKDVFFRALGHCPWSKEVMMEAFVTLGSEAEAGELQSVYRTMTSKGLRIHVDLDEYLEKRALAGLDASGGSALTKG